MSTKVVVGYCSDGRVHTRFHDSLLSLILRKGIGGRISATSGPRIASARNRVVREFLDNFTQDWLWMVDTDMSFDEDILERLLEQDEYLMGALCFGQDGTDGTTFPVIHRLGETGMERITDYPKDRKIPVDATGAACLLIHRYVLEKMQAKFPEPYPFFEDGAIGDKELGEDIHFCLKANQLGYTTFVHTGIVCGHVKEVVLGKEQHHGRTT